MFPTTIKKKWNENFARSNQSQKYNFFPTAHIHTASPIIDLSLSHLDKSMTCLQTKKMPIQSKTTFVK